MSARKPTPPAEEAATELGYHPNWLARAGLKGKPSHLIGSIIPDISNTYYTAIAQAVTAANGAEHSYEPILCVNNEDPLVDLHYLQILQQKRVHRHPVRTPRAGQPHRAFVEELVRGGLPIVEINRQHAGDLLDAAVADNFRGAYQMTAYCIGLGHRRIGRVSGRNGADHRQKPAGGLSSRPPGCRPDRQPGLPVHRILQPPVRRTGHAPIAGPARAAHGDLRLATTAS